MNKKAGRIPEWDYKYTHLNSFCFTTMQIQKTQSFKSKSEFMKLNIFFGALPVRKVFFVTSVLLFLKLPPAVVWDDLWGHGKSASESQTHIGYIYALLGMDKIQHMAVKQS